MCRQKSKARISLFTAHLLETGAKVARSPPIRPCGHCALARSGSQAKLYKHGDADKRDRQGDPLGDVSCDDRVPFGTLCISLGSPPLLFDLCSQRVGISPVLGVWYQACLAGAPRSMKHAVMKVLTCNDHRSCYQRVIGRDPQRIRANDDHPRQTACTVD